MGKREEKSKSRVDAVEKRKKNYWKIMRKVIAY